MLPAFQQKDIENWFTYRPPTNEQQAKYSDIRAEAKRFAELIAELCPPCADTTAAMRKLRETVMAINQAIACNS